MIIGLEEALGGVLDRKDVISISNKLRPLFLLMHSFVYNDIPYSIFYWLMLDVEKKYKYGIAFYSNELNGKEVVKRDRKTIPRYEGGQYLQYRMWEERPVKTLFKSYIDFSNMITAKEIIDLLDKTPMFKFKNV